MLTNRLNVKFTIACVSSGKAVENSLTNKLIHIFNNIKILGFMLNQNVIT